MATNMLVDWNVILNTCNNSQQTNKKKKRGPRPEANAVFGDHGLENFGSPRSRVSTF